MLDSYGDGLTSGPNGFYEGTLDGTTVFGGNVDFGELDEQTFCVGSDDSGSVATTFEPTESPPLPLSTPSPRPIRIGN